MECDSASSEPEHDSALHVRRSTGGSEVGQQGMAHERSCSPRPLVTPHSPAVGDGSHRGSASVHLDDIPEGPESTHVSQDRGTLLVHIYLFKFKNKFKSSQFLI